MCKKSPAQTSSKNPLYKTIPCMKISLNQRTDSYEEGICDTVMMKNEFPLHRKCAL